MFLISAEGAIQNLDSEMIRAFSALFFYIFPRALPWAGMNRAVGAESALVLF
jgi:hypothetical protein